MCSGEHDPHNCYLEETIMAHVIDTTGSGHIVLGRGEAVLERPAHQAFTILRIGFALLPILAGLDKFTHLLVDWNQYLAPAVAQSLPVDAVTFMMIVGVYATLGVFLLIASRDPQSHRSLIWFTVWSSLVHGAIMAVQSVPAGHHGHLLGDVPALFLVAGLLGVLLVRSSAGVEQATQP